MGRPPVVTAPGLLERLYVEQRLSLRECARRLGVSKWRVIEGLRGSGVEIREHDQAVDLQRYLDDEDVQRARGCVWPNCSASAAPQCGAHDEAIAAAAGAGQCAWPGCSASGSEGMCYFHRKAVAGLLSL